MSTPVTVRTPSNARTCLECGYEMPLQRTSCPHCGRPSFFPNVDLAKEPIEQRKLDTRYQAALTDCDRRNVLATATLFDTVCARSEAVFACTMLKLHREIASLTEIYETFYDLERLRLQASRPDTINWAKRRPQAEIELLGTSQHLDKIHYACLTVDGNGLSSYGDCTVKLAESMIAHRASCFEGNTAVMYDKKPTFDDALRCDWPDRNKICTAVFAGALDATTTPTDFSRILVKNGADSKEDQFIEVHVFGPMTRRTFESIRFTKAAPTHRERVYRQAIEQSLRGSRVTVSTIP